jgi:hypothetical protein
MSGVFSNIKNMGNKISDSILKFDSAILTLIAIVSVIFACIIIYIVYNIYNNKLQGKQLTKTPVKVTDSSILITNSAIPETTVGREYTYSFWIYIDSLKTTYTTDPNKTILPQDQTIFYRSADSTFGSANPVVFMDGLSNKMYFAIKTEDSTLTDGGDVSYNDNPYYIRSMNYYLNPDLKIANDGSTNNINKHILLNIDYVPLQRWVNIAMVVDNKIVTLFVDGEIYSVRSSEEFSSMREPDRDVRGNIISVNKVIDKTAGNLYIGGKTYYPNAYLSKVNFFNYAVDIYTIKRLYNQGPTALGFAGMNINYGVRNPFYKLDNVNTDQTIAVTSSS